MTWSYDEDAGMVVVVLAEHESEAYLQGYRLQDDVETFLCNELWNHASDRWVAVCHENGQVIYLAPPWD